MRHTYLYGIIKDPDGAATAAPCAESDTPVQIVAHNGLGCVVSDHVEEEVGSLPREEIVRRLFAYQRVVEQVTQRRPVLPVKFGTVLDHAQEALELLNQGRAKFAEALGYIQDKIEMDVAATWDTNRVLQAIGRQEEVARRREELARKGQPTLEERVQLGQLVNEQMDSRRDRYRKRMVGLLKPLAFDMVPNPLLSDQMVMNVAFLIDREKEHAFDERIRWLDQLFDDEVNLRVIGPLPPYSFATVEVTRLTLEQVEEARSVLGVDDVTAEDTVRRAYRRRAAEAHRSLGAGDLQAKEQFARLGKAANLLMGYCRTLREAHSNGIQEVTAAPKQGPLFSITIRRTENDEVDAARFGGSHGSVRTARIA